MKKIDIHIHTFKEKQPDNGAPPIPSSSEFIESVFPELGADIGVILPVALGNDDDTTILREKYEKANEEAYQLVQESPDSFYWYCAIDPRMAGNDPHADLSAILNRYKKLGARGVGEMYANIYFDDPFMENLLFHCQACEMPILFHMAAAVAENQYGLADDIGLPRLEKMLAKFPSLVFIGHSQIFWSEISSDVTEATRGEYPKGRVTPGRVVELMKKYPNLYTDLSAGSGYNALARDPEFAYQFLEEFQDRIMFGSDYIKPRGDIALPQFLDEAVEKEFISRTAYEKIIRLNAQRVLNIKEPVEN